jgi:cytoskeletal protein RodZ
VGEFGEKFRKERERRGLTLDDVSSVTKINSRMLKAIEGEHFDQLPGGVFNKGFVRAYAKHLGFNDEEAITEYLAVLREAQIGAQTAEWQPGHRPETHIGIEHQSAIERRPEMSPPNSPTVGRKSVEVETQPLIVKTAAPVGRRPELAQPVAGKIHASSFHPETAASANGRVGGVPWKIPAIVLAIVVVGVGLWGRHSRNARAEQANPPRENNAQTTSSTGVYAGATPTSSDPKAGGTAAVSMPSSAPGDPASASSTPDPKPGSQSAIAAAKQPKASETTDVTVRTFESRRATAEATKAPTTFTLVIRATETSWISVAADGQVVNQETLIAPAHTSVRANHEIVVKAGNAAGVSFLLNGKDIPAQGDEGEVKTYVFDSTGMRTAAPGQAPGDDR